MEKIKNFFKSQNQFEKLIDSSSLLDNTFDLIDQQSLISIKTILEGKHRKFTEEESIKIFQNKISEDKSKLFWNVKIKILSLLHRLIMDLGEGFAQEIVAFNWDFMKYKKLNSSKHKVPKFKSKQNQSSNDTVIWIHDNLISFYQIYLTRIALNYQIYRICIEEGELPTSEDFKLDYKLKFMWIFKISNLFNFISQVTGVFEIVFKEFEQEYINIIRDVALLVMHDMMAYYDVLVKEILVMIENYTLFTTTDVIQFYQSLEEVLESTKKLKQFYKLQKIIDPLKILKEPSWIDISEDNFEEITNFYNKIQLLNTGSISIKKQLKEYLKTQPSQNNNNNFQQFNVNNPLSNYQGPVVFSCTKTQAAEAESGDQKETINDINNTENIAQGQIQQIFDDESKSVLDNEHQRKISIYSNSQDHQFIKKALQMKHQRSQSSKQANNLRQKNFSVCDIRVVNQLPKIEIPEGEVDQEIQQELEKKLNQQKQLELQLEQKNKNNQNQEKKFNKQQKDLQENNQNQDSNQDQEKKMNEENISNKLEVQVQAQMGILQQKQIQSQIQQLQQQKQTVFQEVQNQENNQNYNQSQNQQKSKQLKSNNKKGQKTISKINNLLSYDFNNNDQIKENSEIQGNNCSSPPNEEGNNKKQIQNTNLKNSHLKNNKSSNTYNNYYGKIKEEQNNQQNEQIKKLDLQQAQKIIIITEDNGEGTSKSNQIYIQNVQDQFDFPLQIQKSQEVEENIVQQIIQQEVQSEQINQEENQIAQ